VISLESSTTMACDLPERVTWYDVLGVSSGASAVTVRRAHDERLLQLRCYLPLPSTPPPGAPSVVASAAARAAATVEAAWQVLGDPEQRRRYDAGLAAPLPGTATRRRRVAVPDLRGLFYRSGQAVTAAAGLRLAVVRLTDDPVPVEGLVVGQTPDPGEAVRPRSTLTVELWHPPRGQ